MENITRTIRNSHSARIISHRALQKYLNVFNLVMIKDSDLDNGVYNIVTSDYKTQVATIQYKRQ